MMSRPLMLCVLSLLAVTMMVATWLRTAPAATADGAWRMTQRVVTPQGNVIEFYDRGDMGPQSMRFNGVWVNFSTGRPLQASPVTGELTSSIALGTQPWRVAAR